MFLKNYQEKKKKEADKLYEEEYEAFKNDAYVNTFKAILDEIQKEYDEN